MWFIRIIIYHNSSRKNSGSETKASTTTVTTAAATTAGASTKAEAAVTAAQDTNKDGQVVVAFSQGDNGNSWRVTSTDDLKATAEKYGYKFIWTDAGADPNQQLSDISDLISQKPDVLIVDPVEAEAVTPCVELAKKANIPLITIDRAVNAEVGTGTYIADIEQDFVEVGRLAAQYVVDYLTKKNGKAAGNVLLITGTVGSSPNTDEENGIKEVFAKNPDIKILDDQSGDYARDTARSVMDDYLNKYSAGQVDALICFNDEETFGAMQAMEDAGRTDLKGAIVSKDGLRDAIGKVIDGEILGIVQCTPYFGTVTMDLVKAVTSGKSYEKKTAIPFTCFDLGKNADATKTYYQHLVDNKLDY